MLLRDWAVFIVVDSSTSMKVITRWNVREQQKYQVDVKGLMLAWHSYCCHVARTIAFSIITLLRENRSKIIEKIKILFTSYVWHITILYEFNGININIMIFHSYPKLLWILLIYECWRLFFSVAFNYYLCHQLITLYSLTQCF